MSDQPRDDSEPNSEPDVVPPAPPELAVSPVAPPPPTGDAPPAPPAPGAATPPVPGAATPPAPGPGAPPAPPIVPGASASTDAPQAPASEASGVAARAWFAPFTPSVLLGGLAHVGVTVGAAFLGALVLLCVLLTLGSAGSTPVGDVSDLLDGAGTLVGLVFTLMAFILGGEITARASGDAGFFSAMGAMSLWMFPLLITAAVLVVVLWWGVRQERLHPLPTRLHRLGWAAAVGLVTGLVLLVLALIFAVRGGGSGFGIELSAAGFRVVLFSLLLVGAAAYLGRQAGALAQPGEIWASATRRLVQRAPRVVREWLSYVAFGTALFAVLGAINLVVAMWDANGAASIGAALVMMLNIAPFAAAVGHLGGVSGSGGIGELISSKTITVFNGGDPLLWIAVVGAVLLTAFTALWIGTRRPRTDRIVWGTAWQLPVIVFGAWLILGSLFFGIGIGVSGSFGGGLGGSFGGGLGVALWSSFVFLIWAVLVELGAQTLPRLVYGSMPEVHRALAGKSAVAAWVAGTTAATGTAAVSTATATGVAPAPPLAEPKPLSPAAKRGLIIGLSSVGAVVVLLIAGMIAVGVVNSSRTPAAVAEQYLGHLAAGRANEANALVDPDVPNAQRGLLTDEVLGAASERITDITVHDDEGDGDSRVLAVSYKLDGVTHEDYLEARKGEPEWFVLDTWTLTSSLAAPVSIWSQTGATLSIGGAEFEAVAQDQTEIVLYPGVYELALADTTYFGLDDTTLLVARDTMSSKELVLRPTDALNDEVRAQIGAVLDECLASTDPDPDGCPFRVYTYNDDTEVTWTMPSEPSVEIGDDGTSVMVEGTVVGSFSEEFFGTVREDDAEDTFSMYGELTITDGAVTVEFDDGWW